MFYFQYGEREISELKNKDKHLSEAIDRIGFVKREVIPDLFTALVNSIIGQQISMKAAESIWNKTLERFSPITPENISKISAIDIKSVGISLRKAENIKKIAEAIINGEFSVNELSELSEEEIISRLCKLNGVGVWTAEMLMIFSMQRKNILSRNDFGIKKGLMMLYNLENIQKSEFEEYKNRFSPYCSIASLYLWEIAKGR